MRFILILALSMTATAAEQWWCNDGSRGNGGCEANGLKTYCCALRENPVDDFQTVRAVTVTTNGGPTNSPFCGVGTLKCAP
ncbi:hypothetical protein HYFRA_00002959 [Hymenoscyphus fraxineus]|uniref:Hydrophobin n=1 Tax=Hymenoscyphus fraxineus TaxID=746836 RepID=A0A9N9KRK0_9HELO|nr:hypothetical protein HYFRA_00002959 [Hymenoscyphus fraxineus]